VIVDLSFVVHEAQADVVADIPRGGRGGPTMPDNHAVFIDNDHLAGLDGPDALHGDSSQVYLAPVDRPITEVVRGTDIAAVAVRAIDLALEDELDDHLAADHVSYGTAPRVWPKLYDLSYDVSGWNDHIEGGGGDDIATGDFGVGVLLLADPATVFVDLGLREVLGDIENVLYDGKWDGSWAEWSETRLFQLFRNHDRVPTRRIVGDVHNDTLVDGTGADHLFGYSGSMASVYPTSSGSLVTAIWSGAGDYRMPGVPSRIADHEVRVYDTDVLVTSSDGATDRVFGDRMFDLEKGTRDDLIVAGGDVISDDAPPFASQPALRDAFLPTVSPLVADITEGLFVPFDPVTAMVPAPR
jgi:Ca2+-binding RTX toxin-like protein